jgi:hypothetical protein
LEDVGVGQWKDIWWTSDVSVGFRIGRGGMSALSPFYWSAPPARQLRADFVEKVVDDLWEQ